MMDLEIVEFLNDGDLDGILGLYDEIASFDTETTWSFVLRLLASYVTFLRTGRILDGEPLRELHAALVARGNWGWPAGFGAAIAWAGGDFALALELSQPSVEKRFGGALNAMASVYAMSSARLSSDTQAYERWARPARAAVDTRIPVAVARREFVLAEDAARGGDARSAVAHMRASLDAWAEYGLMAPVEADVRARLAELLAMAGLRDEARVELDAALAYWRKGGADWYAAQVVTRCAAHGATPTPASESSAKRSSGHLTRREREVASLVARGLTNREIARQLTLSVRTAESHVEQLRSKLGFRTRAQIAAWVSRTYGEA